MSVTNLPASPDTRLDFKNFVLEENCDHLPVTLVAGATYLDMVVVVPWCGLADKDIAANGDGTLHVKEGILVRTSRIATGAVFNTSGQEVWFDTVTEEYTDTEDAGLYCVGYVREAVNNDGVFGFEKRRYVLEGEAT